MIRGKNLYIYGPINSRRLGLSLGINLTPYKTCSFDCVYCQAGRTTMRTGERKEYSSAGQVLSALREWLDEHKDTAAKLSYVTIAGTGAPCLNNKLGEIILDIKKMVDLPVAVITNSSMLVSPSVRKELLSADLVVPSLDAARQETFEKIDRPVPGTRITDIINALEEFRKEYPGKIWLEIMLVRGLNDSPEDIAGLKQAVERIKPDKIQVNSPVRKPAEEGVVPLDKQRIEEIMRVLGPSAETV
jgi:wyosine [tRNA(Phe)-imidazoG37] synthetase (radical SAM superfamily)